MPSATTLGWGTAAIIAFDAVTFTLNQRRRLRAQPATLAALEAYMDDKPAGSCKPNAACINSIDATCAKLACRAKDADCSGDYTSGECKDIKDLHDAGGCEFASEKCGRKLPNDAAPQCRYWWDYRCRVTRLLEHDVQVLSRQ